MSSVVGSSPVNAQAEKEVKRIKEIQDKYFYFLKEIQSLPNHGVDKETGKVVLKPEIEQYNGHGCDYSLKETNKLRICQSDLLRHFIEEPEFFGKDRKKIINELVDAGDLYSDVVEYRGGDARHFGDPVQYPYCHGRRGDFTGILSNIRYALKNKAPDVALEFAKKIKDGHLMDSRPLAYFINNVKGDGVGNYGGAGFIDKVLGRAVLPNPDKVTTYDVMEVILKKCDDLTLEYTIKHLGEGKIAQHFHDELASRKKIAEEAGRQQAATTEERLREFLKNSKPVYPQSMQPNYYSVGSKPPEVRAVPNGGVEKVIGADKESAQMATTRN